MRPTVIVRGRAFALQAVLTLLVAIPAGADSGFFEKASRHLPEDAEWVALVRDWDAADRLTGGLLSFAVPVETLAGGRLPAGTPALVAGRSAPSGDHPTVLVLPKEALSAECLKGALPLPIEGAETPAEMPTVFLAGDLAIAGSWKMVRPAESPTVHPLVALALALPRRAYLAFAGRPVLFEGIPSSAFTEALAEKGRFGLALLAGEREDLAEVLFAVPWDPMEAEDRAVALRVTAAAYVRESIARIARDDPTLPADARLRVDLAARVSIWPDWGAFTDAKGSLRARILLPAGDLPFHLSSALSFGSAREAMDAHLLARATGQWGLYLATLDPRFRSRGRHEGWLRPDAFSDAEERFYVLDPTLDEADRAEFRLRVQDSGAKETVQDLAFGLVRTESGWRIAWIVDYRAREE